MLPLKKIYIDSRHSTGDSKNSSNFKIELATSYKMPPDTVFFITDVCIPHSWKTVETGINDRLYFSITINFIGIPRKSFYIATIASGLYDGAGFTTALNSAMQAVCQNNLSATYNASDNSLTITLSGQDNIDFHLYSDNEILAANSIINNNWNGGSYNGGPPGSCNDHIQNFPYKQAASDVYTTYKCDFLNLQTVNNVYLTSPNLGSFDTISPFSNNVIKKIPVNANYGYMIYDQGITTNDFLDCSNLTLKTLEFHLRDGKGNYINLHGAHVTFSIVFNKYNINI